MRPKPPVAAPRVLTSRPVTLPASADIRDHGAPLPRRRRIPMASCQQCGAAFEFPVGLHEVTTCRILCPQCSSARGLQRRGAKAPAVSVPPPSVAPLAHRDRPDRPTGRSRAPAATPAPHGVAAQHRLLLGARRRRQTMFGLASIAGVLLLGAVVALIAF